MNPFYGGHSAHNNKVDRLRGRYLSVWPIFALTATLMVSVPALAQQMLPLTLHEGRNDSRSAGYSSGLPTRQDPRGQHAAIPITRRRDDRKCRRAWARCTDVSPKRLVRNLLLESSARDRHRVTAVFQRSGHRYPLVVCRGQQRSTRRVAGRARA